MDKQVTKKLKSGLILTAACALILAMFAVPGLARTEEISADVTQSVISADANQAGLFFLATPDSPNYADALTNAEADGFTWSANLAIIEGSESAPISGKPNQLPAPGSGFAFSLNVRPVETDLRAAIGFNSVFYLTPEDDNLGEDTFSKLLESLEALPDYQGWVMPEPALLTSLGIGVYTEYQGEAIDITDRASYGINLAEKDAGTLLFSYGAVMVDREIADISTEGYPLLVSDEEELIWNDGAADDVIIAQWWIGKTDVSAETGAEDIWLADYANPFLGVWQSDIPSANATLTFSFKPDATFDYELSNVPADQGGVGSGGYIVNGNVMVSFLAFEGAAGYVFEVADNDTINVTEILDVVDGEPILGNTAPFVRVEGSEPPSEDLPFKLDNPFVGLWDAELPSDENPDELFSVRMEYKDDGTGLFTLKPDMAFPEAQYFVSDNYLVTYSPWETAYEVFSFTVLDDQTIEVTEVLSILPDGAVEYGATALFIQASE